MGWFPYVEDLADGADLPVDIVKIALGLTAVVLISTFSIIQVLFTGCSPVESSVTL